VSTPPAGRIAAERSEPSEADESPWRASRERAPHRDVKRDAVLRAAAKLFTTHGFKGTSLDDIAASLGVTKPTLYHYVANKEEILFACVQRGLDALRSAIAETARQSIAGRERLRAVLRQYAAIVTGDYGLCVIRVGEEPLSEPRRRELRALQAGIDAEFRALIEDAMANGTVAAGDAATAAYSVVGALGGIGRWYRPEALEAHSLQDAVDHCIEMLMRGVLAEPRAPAAAPPLPLASAREMRRELHFDNRMVCCYAQRPRNVAAMLAAAVQARPDGEALANGELRLSWRALHHAASKCAGGLAQRGVRPGDRVAVHLGNVPEFVIATLACAWLGAVLVPVDARASGPELEHVLADSGAVAVVCAEPLATLLKPAAALAQLRLRFTTEADAAAPFEPWRALMQAEPLVQPHDAAEEDLAVLLYTSGTTGRPKGVMLTHLNIAHSVLHYVDAMDLTGADRSIAAVPLSHVTGLVAQLYPMLHCAGTLVLMRHFKAAEFVRLAARERVTHMAMVPAMYNLCLLLPDLEAHDLRTWRIAAYGGAPMPPATIDGIAARLPWLALMNAYGGTETCSPGTIMPQGQTPTHRDSVGRAVACGEIAVVDDLGRELPPGETGEIWIAGPMVSPGYWRNPEATASEFRAGFWRSGDIGSQDTDGFVRVLDRKKDMIDRGGYKIYCATVEAVLAAHPDVVESALVGVPCAVLGERVHAFVCVHEIGDATSAVALQAFVAAQVADYAVPETWTIGTELLPRNANGKILKRVLRQGQPLALQ
jgi:acyl-CoA synthetase (AMP-forming)/AMP-acid ligase II/AcrR family transcriptional regulator